MPKMRDGGGIGGQMFADVRVYEVFPTRNVILPSVGMVLLLSVIAGIDRPNLL